MEGVSGSDTAWMLTSTALVLVMTPGLAFFYGGLVRGENVLHTMMMSILCMGIVSLLWCLVGFSLAFGSGGGGFIGDFRYTGLTGLEATVWPGTAIPALLYVAFQMTFNIIAGAIISGSVVERMRLSAFAAFITLWCLLVYVPVCHWVWAPTGWLFQLGAKDFAGGTVVHEITAVSALVLAALLGPREIVARGSKPEPHNVPFVVLGAALLWFGWAGFNGGSAVAANGTAALAQINTYLAASASLAAWATLERVTSKRLTTTGTVTGAVVGLVIITPACGFVSPVGACIMGAVGCALAFPTFRISHTFIDDSLDAFPCHGISGFIGMLMTGCFATDGGLFYGGGWHLLGMQAVAAIVPMAYAAGVSAAIFLCLRCFMRMRVSADEEEFGLDKETAYTHSPGKSYTHSPAKSVISEDTSKAQGDAAQVAKREQVEPSSSVCAAV